MSKTEKRISVHEAIPLIQPSGIFYDENKKSRFAVTNLGYGTGTPEEQIFKGMLQLRSNVYIDQTGFLDEDARLEDGTERDVDDERSQHFAVIENRVGGIAVIACMRLINRGEIPLPIEELIPGAFETDVAENKSVEVSRFIVLHNEKRERALARTFLLATALSHIRNNDLGPAYAIVESELDAHLTGISVPTQRISEPVWVEEYNTTNFGIRIDTDEMIRRFGDDLLNDFSLQEGEYKYWGSMEETTKSLDEAV